MTHKTLLALGVRLFAVWLALRGASYTYFLTIAIEDFPEIGSPRMVYLLGVAILGVSIALWLFPMVVVNAVLPRSTAEVKWTLTANEVARVGVGLLGLWLLAETVPQLLSYLFNEVVWRGDESFFRILDAEGKFDLVARAVQAALAALMIINARLLGRWIVPEFESSVASGAVGELPSGNAATSEDRDV